jgi:hypothetical protein
MNVKYSKHYNVFFNLFDMKQVVVTEISGGTSPINVFISDIYGNNETFLGVINGTVPPEVEFNTVIPAIFQTANEILLKMVDDNGCQVFKVLTCEFGDFIITQNGIIIITQNGGGLIVQSTVE